MKYDFLIVGAGFTGAVLAERIASALDKRVLLIDRRPQIGGNAYDRLDADGVLVHLYGPHIFHTNAPRVADYLSRFTAWRPYEHRVRGLYEDRFVPLPINYTSLEMIFGEKEGGRLARLLAEAHGDGASVPILKLRDSEHAEIRRLAEFIYETFFLHYTSKQWDLTPEQLDASVSARVPVRLSRDDRYFLDSFQNMPAGGYTALFERMLAHPNIEIRLETALADIENAERFDRIIYTGPIDAFFDYALGALPYRSLRFDFTRNAGAGLVQASPVENYPTPRERHPYTRSTEFRHLTGQADVAHSTQVFEYPEAYAPGVNEPYYPIPREENRALYRRYAEKAARLGTVLFAGRLGDYQYYNMDQAVARALTLFEREIAA